MRRTGILIILFFLLCVFKNSFAQGYEIKVNMPLAANQKIKLAYYFLDKIYARDSLLLDNEGLGIFEGDSLLPQGLYMVMLDQERHFDLLLGADQQFSLYNDSINSETMKIKGADETKGFVDYLIFLSDLKKHAQQLEQAYANASPEKQQEIRNQLQGLNEKMKVYRAKIHKKLPDSFLYKFLIANDVPQLDIQTLPEDVQNNDSLLMIARFNYQREHFWDNFDYTDERMLYTPFFKPKLETWFNKVLYPAYDSVKPYVYNFLDDVEAHPRIFQFATSYFLNSSINSKIMGMDALFVDLANDYYFSGKAFWASENSLEKIRENVLFLKDNLIGHTAPDLMMESYDGEFISLHQEEAPLTVVLIYEPNCGHCKVFVPKFHDEVYQKFKDKGLQVFAIYSMDNKEEWSDFLIKHDLFDWINVWDPDHTTRFKILLDARTTPGVYVLDENKTIIAKKMDVEQLQAIISDRLN